jgi:hydroxyacylglutathione hydrolase
VQEQMRNGTLLVDGRTREAFAREHIPNALNFGLDDSFATYVGWLLPFNIPLMILIEDKEGRREAVVQLVRIGYERVEGYLDGGLASWKAAALPTSQFASIDIATLYKRWSQREPLVILDVRWPDEWRNGHIPGAHHIHIADPAQRMDDLSREQTIVTLCHSGYRSTNCLSFHAMLYCPRTPERKEIPSNARYIAHAEPLYCR